MNQKIKKKKKRDLLEYRNEIIKAFKDGTFRSEHLKEVDDAAHKYMLKDANTFIEKIRSMEEKVNLSLFEEFFDHSSPADYAKILFNTENAGENKENIEVIGDRILALKDRIERMSEKEKKNKNVDETLEIIQKILDHNKEAQKLFHRASKVGKRKSKSKIEESIAQRTKLRKQKLNVMTKKEENIYNKLFSYYFKYSNPDIMFKRLRDSMDQKSKNTVKINQPKINLNKTYC